MNTRKTLAVMAITGSLLGMTACSNDKQADESYHLIVNGEDRGMVTGDDDAGTKQAMPTDFADQQAQQAVADLCNKLDAQDVAGLLGLDEVKVEQAVSEPQSSMEKPHAYCLFDAPTATMGADNGSEGQTFLSISVKGPAETASTSTSGGVVKFTDGSTGYYSDTTLLVSPAGSAYEFAFDVVLPYEVTTASGLDAQTTDLWRTKAAEAAGGALN